jgi:hypothetical protein
MSEQATPFVGSDAEAIKARAAAFDRMREAFEQYDISDPQSWVVLGTNGNAMILAGTHQLPQVAYALSHMLVAAIGMADESGDPLIAMATRYGMAQVLEETISSEEKDHEDDQPRASS